MANYSPVSDVHKIAVLRANAIGDYMFTLPALDALKKAYPQAEIVLLGQEWHAHFLEGRPGPVDRVMVTPFPIGLEHPPADAAERRELEDFFSLARAEKFDLAIQMYGGGRTSNPFVSSLGARLTAGLKTPDAPPLDRWVPYVYFMPEVLRYLELVSLLGARTEQVEPRLQVTPRDLQEAAERLPHSSRPLVVLHPGAGDPRRRWPPEKFAQVGDALAQAGARIIISGIEEERYLVEAIASAMRQPHLVLCSAMSLNGVAGMLSQAALVVSNDSGPLHLAQAVGAPTVGIYWCGNLITAGPMTRMRHRPVISWRLNCPVCGVNTLEHHCNHAVSYVADVCVEDVISAAEELLNQAIK